MGKKINTYRILVGKLEVKGPLARLRRRWEDNIKMDHKLNGKAWNEFICPKI
jgi:hypothetical protein